MKVLSFPYQLTLCSILEHNSNPSNNYYSPVPTIPKYPPRNQDQQCEVHIPPASCSSSLKIRGLSRTLGRPVFLHGECISEGVSKCRVRHPAASAILSGYLCSTGTNRLRIFNRIQRSDVS